MPRYDPAIPRLYGLSEAAAYLGITPLKLREHVRNHTKETPIVAPIAKLKCGMIWSESQLDETLYIWRNNPRVHRASRIRADSRLIDLELQLRLENASALKPRLAEERAMRRCENGALNLSPQGPPPDESL